MKNLTSFITETLESDKGFDIVTIELDPNLTLADALVFVSGSSSRHVAAMADKLKIRLKTFGIDDVIVEGLEQANWAIVDAGDVIVHIFRPEVREFYNIEKMWGMETPKNSSSHIHA